MESTHAKESCDYCPENEVSGGCEMCRSCSDDVECPCLAEERPCSPGVQCVNLPDNKYKCLSCPAGFEDSEGGCVDIDECERFSPCFAELNVTCTNTVPGFKCDSCPTGYTGNAPQGIGEPDDKQHCTDIDECATDNGNCDINSECINQPGYHYCGYCFGQYVGNGTIPCKSGDYCESGQNTCDTNAKCTVTGPAGFVCECNILYAGNGTACGIDTDGDGYPDNSQNCQGPTCIADNCAYYPNTDQEDLDNDGLGDECDSDIDEDLSINEKDWCPYDPDIASDKGNKADTDNDGWLNDCDNCPTKKNVDQYDKNSNDVGDKCDTCDNGSSDPDCFVDVLPACTDNTGKDSDGDGVDDKCDNCMYESNSAQRDTDGDGIGDSCDDDIDGDFHPNTQDNCVYRANPGQENKDKDFKGDICDDSKSWPHYMVNDADADGDGVADVEDICPFDKEVSEFNFATSQLMDLSTFREPGDIRWRVRSKGHDVDLEALMYEESAAKLTSPVALLGETRFEELQFDGTFYVKDNERYPTIDTGTIGIIFGYQELHKKQDQSQKIVRFYLATWRHDYHTFNNCAEGKWDNCYYGATTGLQIKSVTIHSTAGAANRKEILWWSASKTETNNKITTNLIYQDPKHVTWDFNQAYRWRLHHHPSTGRIHLSIHTVQQVDSVDTVTSVVDTGDLYDKRIRGGRIGLYSFGQWNVTFANTAARCLTPQNYAANLNGNSHVIKLGELSGLGISRSFQISAWFKIAQPPENGTSYPIICKNKQTNLQTLCVSITSELKLVGEYAEFTVESEEEVTLDTWLYFVIRYDMQYKNIRLYHNMGETKQYVESEEFVNVGPVSEELVVGSDGDQYFKGQIDEIRIIHRLLHEEDYLYTLLFKPSLAREDKMRLIGAHLNFDRDEIVDVLENIQVSVLNTDSTLLPPVVKSAVMGQMYRYDEGNRGGLERSLYLTSDRKKREISKRRKKTAEHECNDTCRTGSHDEL
ncbi:cartilage oligomeric matrix protein-like [Bolinopsis microptera]|uniref:cartilage oligomeric matrix protein-like n=1 Tax=Bolinopsis microptera TaxID=2820187 RepID=UPI003079949F